MRYLPNTAAETKEMLAAIGAGSVRDLFTCVPKNVLLKEPPALPAALSEMEIEQHMHELGARNTGAAMLSFLGGGCYRHYAPSLIDQMLIRSEFYTAYTPYQPEASQGTLRAIFEFQTMIANLFAMDVSNASMYDGATAAAEAVMMALRNDRKKRTRIVVASTVHPHYIATVKTYLEGFAGEMVLLDMDPITGRIAGKELAKITPDTVAVLFQYPNWFGVIEDIHAIAKAAKAVGAWLIPTVIETTALGILTAPGQIDADIAVGEGQPLGIAPNYGGPGVGLFTVKNEHLRKMPGRLVGKTADREGKECYVLTLSAREQHIKREKATSNICSNQGLMALAASMYLATMGKTGLRKVALMNLKRKECLLKALAKTKAKPAFTGPAYNEIAILLPVKAEAVVEKMAAEGILAGVPASRYYPALENILITATTELHSCADTERFTKTLAKVIGG
jgi:glycine dehydrogenase subunit 1